MGCVTAACLADHGHDVAGIDLDETKVAMINAGRSPIIEPGLEALIQRGLKSGKLYANCEADSLGDVALRRSKSAPQATRMAVSGSGRPLPVIAGIGHLLKATPKYVIVNIRSTVLPGTVEQTLIPALEEASGKVCGNDFGVCMNPEFMRETTAVRDFGDPPFTVIGSHDHQAGLRVAEIYARLEAPVEHTTIREAEMIKYRLQLVPCGKDLLCQRNRQSQQATGC